MVAFDRTQEYWSPDENAGADIGSSIHEPPPFRPVFVLLVGLISGYIGAGMLTAVNWIRLGRPGRFWPTLLFSMVGIPLILGIIGALAGPAAFIVGMIGSIVAVIWYSERQKPDYNTWVVQHAGSRPTLAQSGYGMIALVIATSIAVIIFYTQVLPVIARLFS